MPAYPQTGQEPRVRIGELYETVAAIFRKCGMSGGDAALLADTLVVADAQGVHSHGTLRVPDYAHKLTHGGVDPRGLPRLISASGAVAVVDGGNSMGQIGTAFAMKHAVAMAREHGLGAVAVRGSNHCGALAYFTRMAVAADMIGIAATNALPTMAPWGGVDKIVGMNPLSVAIPAARQPPLVFDAGFAASSHGKIRVYAQKGVPLPDGWAYDRDGQPTTDAARAMVGLLQPIGGHKGVALAMVMGILSSLLSGAAYGLGSGNMDDGPVPGVDGHFVLAIDVAPFGDPVTFKRRVDGIVEQVRGSRRAPGVERLYAPGEIELETERTYRERGIPLTLETLAAIQATARELGVVSALAA